jgi:hypothetical protein
MPNIETVDWFARDEESYRDEARNYLDSYAHPWDILAEMAQNAVDAIEDASKVSPCGNKGQLVVEMDRSQRSILFRDNGIGITAEDLKKVLAPHFSGKRGKGKRGEKGVGLTYIALVGNEFEIITKRNNQVWRAHVKGAQDWLRKSGSLPMISIEELKTDPFPTLGSYTQVIVRDIPEPPVAEDELDLFGLNHAQMSYLLRTRTAIGFTGVLFGNPPAVETDVTLTLKQDDGTQESKSVLFSFESPANRLPTKALISLEDVKTALMNAESRKVMGKSIYFSKIFQTKGGKEVRSYCFLASRHVYNQQNTELKLPEDLRIEGGIYITTKGMPTGILLPTPKTGRAGYWPNFFLVLEYDNITLDLGRKSITAPRIIELLSKQAAQVFNEVDRYIRYIIREDEGTLDALLSQDELQDELSDVRKEATRQYRDNRQGNKLPELYPFTREPKQEQDVIAIFSMSLARGLLPYELMRLSTSYRYDSFLRITLEKKQLTIVAEFKLNGESILKDLEDAKVRYGQLHLMICWKMDEAKLKEKGFIIDPVESGAANRELPGATHKLSFPTSVGIKDQPIAVICLSELFLYEE